MKKYDVSLALASTKSIDKLALARMLIDMMELDELYEPLRYKGSFENLKKLDAEEYFDMLEIGPEERIQKIEAEDAGELKNYDVALSMSATGNIDDAREVMEFLKPLNPKKPLDVSDFENIDKVNQIIIEVTDKMTNAKEMLERKSMRDNLIKLLLPDWFSGRPLSEVSLRDSGKKRPKRRPIDKPTKEAVWIKYMGNIMEGKCYCCGIRTIHITDFHTGHNIAVANGGTDNISNLRPICARCNSGMREMNLEDYKKKYYSEKRTKSSETPINPGVVTELKDFKIIDNFKRKFEMHYSTNDINEIFDTIRTIHMGIRYEVDLTDSQLKSINALIQYNLVKRFMDKGYSHIWISDEGIKLASQLVVQYIDNNSYILNKILMKYSNKILGCALYALIAHSGSYRPSLYQEPPMFKSFWFNYNDEPFVNEKIIDKL